MLSEQKVSLNMSVDVFTIPISEQISALKIKRGKIEKQSLEEIMAELDRKRSQIGERNVRPEDEDEAGQGLAKRKEKNAKVAKEKSSSTYNVQLTENVTQKELLKILFSNNPTAALTVTQNGRPIFKNNARYNDIMVALRASYLEAAEESDELFSLLVDLAIKEEDETILDNYFEALELKHKKSQLNIEKNLLDPETDPLRTKKKCEALLKDAEDRKKYRKYIIAGLVVAAVLGIVLIVAVTATLAVFAPPAAALIIAALPAIVIPVVVAIRGYLTKQATDAVLLGGVSGLGGFLEMIFGSKRKSNIEKLLRKSSKDVAAAEAEEEAIKKEIEKTEAKKIEAKGKFAAAVTQKKTSTLKPEAILQQNLQKDLKKRHPCLSQKPNPMTIGQEKERLRKELETNYALLSPDFVGEDAEQSVKDLVKFICQRNLLKKHLAESNLDNLVQVYSSIPSKDCKTTLDSIDKLKVLQLITSKDLGKDPTLVPCEKLRKLDPEHRIKLLEHCFSLNDAPEDANKKARLVSALLETPGLFESPDSPTKQTIKTEIFWAITPFGDDSKIGVGVPYCNLSQSQSRLQDILLKIPPTDKSLEPIRTGLENALKTAQSSAEITHPETTVTFQSSK